jgi:hypothetical protein
MHGHTNVKILLNICDLSRHDCTFLCQVLLWRWLTGTETCSRITTWLYIILSNCSAVVGKHIVSSLTARNMDNFKCIKLNVVTVGRDRSLGIAICYGIDGPEIEYGWGRNFPHRSRPPASCTIVPTLFPGSKTTRTWHWLWTSTWRRGWRNSRAIPLFLVLVCSRVNFNFTWRHMFSETRPKHFGSECTMKDYVSSWKDSSYFPCHWSCPY